MSDETLKPEDALLRAFLEGGAEYSRAFTELCRTLTPPFLGRLRSHGVSGADAQEVVQRLFVKLWGNRDRIKTPQSARAYLYKCLFNEWKTLLREARVRSRREPVNVETLLPELEEFAIAERAGSPLDEMEFLAQEMNRLKQHDCLGRAFQEFGLRFPERALAVEKQEIEGWSIDEIATALNRTYAATKQFLCTSRKALREFAQERCREVMERD